MTFVDLNVTPPVTAKERAVLCNQLLELGYSAVAYNYNFTGKIVAGRTVPQTPFLDKSKSSGGKPYSSHSTNTSSNSTSNVATTITTKPLLELSRLTLHIEDSSHMQSFSSGASVLKLYDIIAVQPLEEKFLLQCYQIPEVDIISFDMSKRLPFYFKHSMVTAAIEKGIFFEIQYSPSLRDSTARRNLISNSLSLIRVTKGKNIIFSSGALKAFDLRGPYDIANLGLIIGLSYEQALKAVSENPKNAILRAETRLTTNVGAVRVTAIPKVTGTGESSSSNSNSSSGSNTHNKNTNSSTTSTTSTATMMETSINEDSNMVE